MCGITGSVWTDNSRRISREQLECMTNTLTHRGPDDVGSFYLEGDPSIDSPSVALGFRRLSIIDLQTGHQPITNEDESVWLVFNGEIYNYLELRNELQKDGHQFSTRSDSEVVVHLYEKYGTDMFQYLNGMFGLAIWDDRQKELVLGRDRLGQKPLYYSQQRDRLLFASELKSLIASGVVDQEIDPRALDHYFIYQYIPHPLCIYKDVCKLSPGHFAVFKQGQLKVTKYWHPDFNQRTSLTASEIPDKIANLLTDSVKLRLQSDVPVGAFLSGGVDSSIMVALMQRHANQQVQTFSIGFPIKAYDESTYARQVANHLGTDHHEFMVEPSAVEILPSLVRHYDEPFSDSSAIPTWYVSQFTRQHVTVAISGDGGDELFAGYPRYKAIKLAETIDRIPPLKYFLGSPIARLLPYGTRYKGFFRRLKRFLTPIAYSPIHRYLDWINIFPYRNRLEYYTEQFQSDLEDHDPADFLTQAWQLSIQRSPISKASLGDLVTYLPCDLNTKVDLASMAHSLECRQPFLDHRLVEFAAQIPATLKFNRGVGKQILKTTFHDLLPESIWNRPKMGFGVPLDTWFRQELHEQTGDSLLSSNAKCHQWVKPSGIQQLFDQHCTKKRDHSGRLWSLLMLENWLQHWC